MNASESGGTLAVSGTVAGEFNAGDAVTLSVDGPNYTGTVNGAGVFSINVPGAKLAANRDDRGCERGDDGRGGQRR